MPAQINDPTKYCNSCSARNILSVRNAIPVPLLQRFVKSFLRKEKRIKYQTNSRLKFNDNSLWEIALKKTKFSQQIQVFRSYLTLF